MAEIFKFDPFSDPSDPRGARSPHCVVCEEMLADALDQTLSDADQAFFDRHLATCAACSNSMADAQRGAAWLELLKAPRPEPSAHLMERILAQTTGAQTTGAQTGAQTGARTIRVPHSSQPHRDEWVPATTHVTPLPVRRIIPFRLPVPHINLPHFTGAHFEPRLAMTAAMAFFSLALTLNLTGVKLNQLHASDLQPSSVERIYFEANARASRYYNNLRVVHVLESRVEDLRQSTADAEQDRRQPEPQPESRPESRPAPDTRQKPAPGVSRQETRQETRQPYLQAQSQPLLTDRSLPAPGSTVSFRQSNREGGLA